MSYSQQEADLITELESLRAQVETLQGQLKEAKRERDLAIAHDRQPYPTAWAYEQACKQLTAIKEQNALLTLQVLDREAAIDRLMMEYCPDEMTDEQKANWAAYQIKHSAQEPMHTEREE